MDVDDDDVGDDTSTFEDAPSAAKPTAGPSKTKTASEKYTKVCIRRVTVHSDSLPAVTN